MSFFLRLNVFLILCAGVHCIHQVSWLSCQFFDEHVFLNSKNLTETKLIHREALLQFGQKGDAPVNPHGITFLVTGSKLDLRRYLEGVDAEQLECELHRFSTPGIHIRWPVKADQEYSRWFTCILRHTKGLFKVTGLLRHPTDKPPSGQPDYHSWAEIKDTDILTTTVALVTETKTPSVKARLGSKQKLHCQFAVDHKTPHITVEWQWHQYGRRDKLFSYNSRTGQTQGSGVSLKNLADGDASLSIPRTDMSREGKYFCSVSVNPLFISMEINLHIEEAPHVSLNVGSALSLQEGEEQKISCVAESYYPLDVEIIMDLMLKILIYSYLFAGVHCIHQVSWLPCQFFDEHVFLNSDNHTETKIIHREALLQFGQKGDAPVNPHGITFLVTGSKLDLRRYFEGVEAEQMECELHRFSTPGTQVRWPVKGDHEYSRWFTCKLRHTKDLFKVTSLLRHQSDIPPSGQPDYHSWAPIEDREILTTTVAMVTKTGSPSVKAGQGSEKKLHCQFAVDHKGPDVTVEWQWQHRGERVKLFSHNSRTGQTNGKGVSLKSLAGGDASLNIPFIKMSSEGKYTCSVSVNPLFASMDINLHIEEAPRVSLNIGPTLSLQEGGEQKVICVAERYYPLDVEIVWYDQDPSSLGQRVGAPFPKKLQNVLLSSHKPNSDNTYTLSAFFYLKASLRDSGKQFTCSVSHQSLRVPIRKSFILTVEEPSRWMLYLAAGFLMSTLLILLFVMLSYLRSAREKSVQRKPY
ncbi:uncharacterized protein LKV04_010285 [Tautogolabrus adspersus]